MRLTPGLRPLLMVALTLSSYMLQVSGAAAPFPKDLEPISIVGRQREFIVIGFHRALKKNKLLITLICVGFSLHLKTQHLCTKIALLYSTYKKDCCCKIC